MPSNAPHEVSSIAFTLEETTGAADDAEAGPTVEEDCPAQRNV